jgi:hypothetical protein
LGAAAKRRRSSQQVYNPGDIFGSAIGPGIRREQPKAASEADVTDADETLFGLWNESAQMKSNEQPAVIREINADKSAVIELGDKSTHCSRWTIVDGNPEGARYGACDGRKRDRARRHTCFTSMVSTGVTDYSRYGLLGWIVVSHIYSIFLPQDPTPF